MIHWGGDPLLVEGSRCHLITFNYLLNYLITLGLSSSRLLKYIV